MNAKSMNTANATCKDAPQVVDRHVQPVTDPMMVYSGLLLQRQRELLRF